MAFTLRVAMAFVMVAAAALAAAENQPEISVGSESDFRPYAFVDQEGAPAGFSVDLIKAVTKSMGLRLRISTGPWDEIWNELLDRKLDVLPIVAKTPGRATLIDYSLPHTETFDAFFRRAGLPELPNLAAAAGMEIVVLRSDAAHHQLVERNFPGKVILVESISEGLRRIAEGKHDAMLCSKLIATLDLHEHRIDGVTAGPPIPDYKRVFCFAVPKGNPELLEKLNQGLRIVKTNGEYDRIYERWLGFQYQVSTPWGVYLGRVLMILAIVILLALTWRLSQNTALWEERLLQMLTPLRVLSLAPGWRYGWAIAIAVTAPALRASLNPWLGTMTSQSFGFASIVIVTVFFGLRPGLLSAGVAIVASEIFVVGSRPANWDNAVLMRISIGLVIGIFMVWVMHAARIAMARTRQSELRLASFAAATFEGIVESEDGRILDCNDRFAQMFGQTAEELRGMPISELAVLEDRERVMANIRENRESVTEHAMLRKDGSHIYVEAHGRPATPGGSRRYTTLRDITYRKQAEEALRESEEQFRVLTQNLVSAVALINEHCEIVIVNKSFLRLFELDEDADLLDINCRDWDQWQVFDEAGRLLHVNQHPVRKAAMTRKAVKDVLVQLQCPGNTAPKWVLISAEPILTDQGKLHRMICTYHDITDHKQAEQKLRESHARLQKVLEVETVGVLFWDLNTGRLVDANNTFLKMMEYSPDDLRTHDLTWQKFTPPEYHDATLAEIEKFHATGRIGPYEKEYLRKDGTRQWLLFAGSSLGDNSCVEFCVNISQLKQVQQELTAARDAAQAANVAKSRFLANMSHELRTPMNAILGMIDLALPKTADPIVEDCLKTAKGSADLLLTLLNDLLDSAKIESGKLELEAVPFSLQRMLDQVTRVLSVRASEKGLAFYCRIAEQTPDAVVGDRTRLQQILLNLAGNAIKFTEHGDVEIGLRVLSQDGEVCLEFSVRDTGIGIPPAGMERLFRPFSQADVSMSRRFGGTGLGLSICKNLVEMMGGSIWVQSEVGRGSTFFFTVRLPLAKESPADFELPAVPPTAACGPLRILLVEDNPANQKLATYILQDRGHQVEIAEHGREAIDLIEQNRYDLILMDVQMPHMNGLEATAAIRKRESGGSRMPIIAMTAHAMQDDRDRCLASGMDGYLTKPINAAEMIGLIERLAGGVASSQVSAPLAGSAEALPRAPLPVFNAKEALTRCFDSTDMVREMIHCFYEEAADLIPQMRASLQKGDLVEVGHLGHRMKGTVVYLAAEQAKEAALRVERFCKASGGTASQAEQAIDALEHECIALKAALATHPLAAQPTQG